jgi:hypothetical protein
MSGIIHALQKCRTDNSHLARISKAKEAKMLTVVAGTEGKCCFVRPASA